MSENRALSIKGDVDMPTLWKRPVTRDANYLEWIREQACICCRTKGYIHPHHWPKKGDGSMGMKCSDYRAVPLCALHHDDYHRFGRESFLDTYGATEEHVESLIQRLNERYELCHREIYL